MQRQLLMFFLLGLLYVESLPHMSKHAADLIHCPPPNFFLCSKDHNKCISQFFVCDGQADCESGEDEQDCTQEKMTPPAKECEPHEFQCHDRVHCIPLDEYCDNQKDCLDGSDELDNCYLNKTCDGFRCSNHRCIPSSWACDSVNDCQDNSDESSCVNVPVPSAECNNTIGKYLCANKRCISIKLACDGNNDCGDYSDESTAQCAAAKISCINTTSPCQQLCMPTPKGAKCVCHEGFSLTEDGKCQDIDECTQYNACDQFCINTAGSYYCRCESGYTLQSDGRECKTEAEIGEATMVFASKSSLRGYYLDSKIYFPIADDLQHVVGVSLDSNYVYWSDIQLGDEAIFRSLEDGTKREVIVTAGLGCPEDIAVDWIAGNIYFTDSMYKRIGVCSNGGAFCTVIIKEATEKPRGIALLPSEGKMYWSDWGDHPHIAVSDMDGAKRAYFIDQNIGWPNGLTIDYPSKRLYWVDAKLKVIESILLDGRGRTTVLHDIAKHPYSIAIFENRLYWSDWSTNSIHSCNKLTGKDFNTLFHKNETVYGIHIHHSTLKKKYRNPCITKPCSQLCLLASNNTYTCACTLDKELSDDKHNCRDIVKRKHIAIAAGNTIIDYYHELLGRPRMSASITSDRITALTYDSLTDSIIAADEMNKSIFRFNPYTNAINHIIPIVNEVVESIAFDYFGNNLYKSNTIHKKIEVHSLTTGEKTEFSYTENPYDLVLVPEEGLMFVVFRSNSEFHIDKAQMNGLGSRTHLIEHGLIGPKVSIAYDSDTKRIYWADEGTGRIESVDLQGQNRVLFRTGLTAPVSLAVLDSEIFWASRNLYRLNWADKKLVISGNKGLNLQITSRLDMLYLQTISGRYSGDAHMCRKNNGDCSHICLVTDSSKKLCACPPGYIINADQKSCREKTSCSADEIKCKLSDMCIKTIQKCNGVKDCPDGEDEDECSTEASSCHPDEFQCHSGECIKKANRCDSVFNCNDRSDEKDCDDHNSTCSNEEYRCDNGLCISKYLLCNGENDCDDFSDESSCHGHVCSEDSFKCTSGLCIPRNWECDGQIDCSDGSDEHATCKPAECGEKMFSCKNGRCVDVLLKCNGIDDCNDNSDEANCSDSTKFEALICPKDHVRCRNSTLCIHQTLRCNGQADCPQHEDERGCGHCRSEDQFTCNNHNCIPLEWACDRIDDCGDGSDELLCPTGPKHTLPLPQPSARNCSQGEFACWSQKTGFCLPLEKVCDGEKHCFDGSDEAGECEKACATNTCENVCHKTPTGPLCSCRDGYKLMEDGKSCGDIDECVGNVCSQLCTNRPGSFVCSCFEGYALRINKISCKATGPSVKVITATKDDIRVMSPSSQYNSLTIVHRDPGVEITGLDVNARENTVYWSNDDVGIINKMNIDTKQRTTAFKGVGRPEILAVDWITDNVYFFDYKERSTVLKACDIDANKCSIIVHVARSNDKVTAIAIEPLKEMLFWSEVTWKIYEKPSSQIIRTDLMGAHEQIIVRENLGIVSGLTIDHHRSLLYWADNYQTNIECVDFNGDNRKVILADLITKPVGLYFYEDALYWKTETSGVLRKRQLYGDMSYSLIPIGSNNLNRLFVISQVSRQPEGPNKCKAVGCEHMCVMHQAVATCICADGFPATLRNGTGCVNEEADSKDYSLEDNDARIQLNEPHSPIVTQPQQQTSRRGAGAFTGLAVTLVTFALILTVYFYLKKKRPGFFKGRDLSIHFQNPSFMRRRNNNHNNTSISSNAILIPGEHEYSNPITEMSNTKLSKSESGSKRRLELTTEVSDGEAEEASTTYHSRLIH